MSLCLKKETKFYKSTRKLNPPFFYKEQGFFSLSKSLLTRLFLRSWSKKTIENQFCVKVS